MHGRHKLGNSQQKTDADHLQVKDTKNGECFRADKLLEDFIDNLLTKDKELSSARRDELRKIAAQAGAFKQVE